MGFEVSATDGVTLLVMVPNKKNIKQFQPSPLKTNSVKSLLCFRSDGSFVQMEGVAMVFQSEVTERDEGLYTCRASFYHHTATVNIQVEVMSEDKLFGENLPCCIFHLHAEFNMFVALTSVCMYVFQHWWP